MYTILQHCVGCVWATIGCRVWRGPSDDKFPFWNIKKRCWTVRSGRVCSLRSTFARGRACLYGWLSCWGCGRSCGGHSLHGWTCGRRCPTTTFALTHVSIIKWTRSCVPITFGQVKCVATFHAKQYLAIKRSRSQLFSTFSRVDIKIKHLWQSLLLTKYVQWLLNRCAWSRTCSSVVGCVVSVKLEALVPKWNIHIELVHFLFFLIFIALNRTIRQRSLISTWWLKWWQWLTMMETILKCWGWRLTGIVLRRRGGGNSAGRLMRSMQRWWWKMLRVLWLFSCLPSSAVGLGPCLRLKRILPSVPINIILKPIIHLTQEAVDSSNFE